MLEKPKKFNPPSHPSRPTMRDRGVAGSGPQKYSGPPLSAIQKERMRSKRYPNMMPSKGTFMYWFLTNRSIHVYISCGVLITLAIYIFVRDFLTTTPYLDLLPPASSFLFHPLDFILGYAKIYRMHVDWATLEAQQRRKLVSDDLEKRGEFRKAHGLEDDQSFLNWSIRRPQTPGDSSSATIAAPAPEHDGTKDTGGIISNVTDNQNPETEPRARRPLKKWLGIW